MDKVYLQTYSARVPMAEDFIGGLEKIAKIGYAGVEFAGHGGLSAKDMKKVLADNGLDCISSHIGVGDARAQIDYMAEIGARYIVCPMAMFNGYDAAMALADELNAIGAECKKAGLKYGYHNHTQEFALEGDKFLLELLMENTDPASVIFELDCGWCKTAGVDPEAFIKKHAGRFEMIHVKEAGKVTGVDMPIDFSKIKRDENGRPIFTEEMKAAMDERMRMNVPTGKGLIDWKKIKAAADAQGAKAYIVEREWDYLGDIYACVKEDIEFLKTV